MHNHKGFSKEVQQLKKSLREQENHHKYLAEQLYNFKKSLTNCDIDPEGDIGKLVNHKINEVEENREGLKIIVYQRLEINKRIFELTKQVSMLEGRLISEESQESAREKKYWADELRQLVSQLESKKYNNSRQNYTEIQQQLSQKERLRSALHELLVDLNGKISFVQNKVYEQSFIQNKKYEEALRKSKNFERSSRVHTSEKSVSKSKKYIKVSKERKVYELPSTQYTNYKQTHESKASTPLSFHSSMLSQENIVSKSMQFSPQSSMYSSTPKIEKHYHMIVPSQLELKNLIPRSHLENVNKVNESNFELYGQQFTFLRDCEGNTFVRPCSHHSRYRNQVGRL